MPVREGLRAVAGRSDSRSRGVVARQFLLALGVLGGIWVAGWLIGLVLVRVPTVALAMNTLPALGGHPSTMVKVASLFLALATLAAVLGTVEIAGTVRRWAMRRSSQPVPDHPTQLTRDAA